MTAAIFKLGVDGQCHAFSDNEYPLEPLPMTLPPDRELFKDHQS